MEYRMQLDTPEKYIEIERDEFPNCCGIIVESRADGDLDVMAAGFAEAIENNEYRDHGLILYSLTQKQTEEKAQLLKAGFEALTSFVSPTTNNTITLFGLKVNQPKPKRRRRR